MLPLEPDPCPIRVDKQIFSWKSKYLCQRRAAGFSVYEAARGVPGTRGEQGINREE